MLYGGDLGGGGSGVKSGGLDLRICATKFELSMKWGMRVGSQAHLPRGDVANDGDEGDQDAAGEGAAEERHPAPGCYRGSWDAEVD